MGDIPKLHGTWQYFPLYLGSSFPHVGGEKPDQPNYQTTRSSLTNWPISWMLHAEIPILSCLKFPANPTPLASKHLHWRWVLRPAGPALTVRDAQPEGVHRAVDQPGKSVVEAVGLVQYRCCLILSKLGKPNNMNNLKVCFCFCMFLPI